MATSVSCSYNLGLKVVETGDAADFPASPNARDRRITHSGNDVRAQIQTGETNDPEAAFSAIVSANSTLNLTAAPKNAGGGTQDLTGKKLIALILYAPGADDDTPNAGDVSMGPGASNAYLFLGLTAGETITLKPGMSLTFTFRRSCATSYAAVSASVKNIDFTVGTDELHYTMVFGNT